MVRCACDIDPIQAHFAPNGTWGASPQLRTEMPLAPVNAILEDPFPRHAEKFFPHFGSGIKAKRRRAGTFVAIGERNWSAACFNVSRQANDGLITETVPAGRRTIMPGRNACSCQQMLQRIWTSVRYGLVI